MTQLSYPIMTLIGTYISNYNWSITLPLRMSTRIVSQIKKGVEDVRLRQYSAQKQKKELKYFSLYLKEIVKIQRCFRKFLVRKTTGLEAEIGKELQKKQLLHFQHKRLREQIDEAKLKRQKLRNSNMGKMVECQKENICQNVREIIKNVINCADNYAKNAAVSKLSISELQRLTKQERQMRAQVKEMELQKQCYQRRIANWNQKLKQIRQKIMEEASIKSQIEKQLNSCP